MPREPISNVGFVCPAHAPKPGNYKDKPLEEFVGGDVKLAFPVTEVKGKRRPNFEHMWVKVMGFIGEELVGLLDNDPLYVDMKFGDRVVFKRPAIEDFMPKERSK